jgi:hypothetical protein
MNEADIAAHLESTELVPFSFFSELHASLIARRKKSSVKLDKDDPFDSYSAEASNVTSEEDLKTHYEAIKKTYDVDDKAVWKKLIIRGFACRSAKANSKRRKIDKETEYTQAVQDLSQDVEPVVEPVVVPVQTSVPKQTAPEVKEVKREEKENDILEIKISIPPPRKKIINPFKRDE